VSVPNQDLVLATSYVVILFFVFIKWLSGLLILVKLLTTTVYHSFFINVFPRFSLLIEINWLIKTTTCCLTCTYFFTTGSFWGSCCWWCFQCCPLLVDQDLVLATSYVVILFFVFIQWLSGLLILVESLTTTVYHSLFINVFPSFSLLIKIN
jgi:hypothetical protein